MQYETERLVLKTLEMTDFDQLKAYLIRNKDFLSPWEPLREEAFYSDNAIKERMKNEIKMNFDNCQRSLYLFEKETSKLIGNVTLSSIVRGVFQSCFMGYKLDADYEGKGYMSEAIQKVVEVAFDHMRLHRIEANIMPKNERSIKLVKNKGFEYEGLSKRYLKINGVWEDHAHYTIRNEALEA